MAWHLGEPLLVRNYDYAAPLCEKTILTSAWSGKRTLASTDCLIGVLDGMNEDGLAVSLSFGGRRDVGDGFGAPIVLRYILETCATLDAATDVLRHVPIHMAYNILVVDRHGAFATAYTAPDAPTIVRRTPVSTNHQDRVHWERHAAATETLERERRLYELLADSALDEERLVTAFLEPPLRRDRHDSGLGTLYTAVYRPARGTATFLWPGRRWEHALEAPQEGVLTADAAV